MGVRCAALLAVTGLAAHAQTAPGQFPEKPITLYNAYSSGGSSSVTFRVLADAASRTLGKRVIVEDRPGAGGALAPAVMIKIGRPDGYLLSQLAQPILRIPHIQKTEFDPLEDFTWIIRVVDYTYGMVVRTESPWRNVSEFVANAKAHPGKVTYATSGVGVTMHLAMEHLSSLAGIQMVHVPHKLTADMTNAVLGGHIDVMSSSVAWAPLVDSGKLRVLAILGANRIKRWPDLPTAKEQGYDVMASSSYGIGGPKGMDPRVVKTLHDAFRKALDDPEFVKTMDNFDQVTSYLNTADYTRWAREQYAVEKKVVERFGLKQ